MLGEVRTIPAWCYGEHPHMWWVKGIRPFMPQCQAYSAGELEQISFEDLAKVRAVNPALAEQGMRDAREAQAAFERSHPTETTEWRSVSENMVNAFIPTGLNPLGDGIGNLVALGVVGVALFLVVRG